MPSKKLLRPKPNFIPKTENIAIQLSQIHLNDPTQPNFENDFATGFLLHNACGITAEFDHNGNPQTEIQFRIREPEPNISEFFFPSIAKLTQQQDNWLPVPSGGIVILERAYFDKTTQSISGGWLAVGARDLSSGLEACQVSNSEGIPNLMCVEQQRYFVRANGQRDFYQHRISLDQTKALKFQGMDQFKSCAIEMLDQSNSPSSDLNANEQSSFNRNSRGRGVPGVIIRCTDIGLEHNRLSVQSFARRLELGWDPTQKSRKDPVESVENFIYNLSNSDWMEEIEQSVTDAIHFELIPYQRFNTGFHNLPENQSGEHIRDDSIQYDSPLISELGDLVINDNNEVSMGAGYAPSIQVLTRSGKDDEFQWNVKTSYRTDPTGPISPLSEVITPTLPPEIKEIFEDRANERSEIMVEKLKNAKEEIFSFETNDKLEPTPNLTKESKDTSNDFSMSP